jgi:hypothetical protein
MAESLVCAADGSLVRHAQGRRLKKLSFVSDGRPSRSTPFSVTPASDRQCRSVALATKRSKHRSLDHGRDLPSGSRALSPREFFSLSPDAMVVSRCRDGTVDGSDGEARGCRYHSEGKEGVRPHNSFAVK